MPLPNSFLKKLEESFETTNKLTVKNERFYLTQNYTDQERANLKRRIQNTHQRLSYLATRVPATYAVCEDVLGRLAQYDFEFSSLLDLGAGPGTASICAKYIFPELEKIALIDQDKDFKIFAESFLKVAHHTQPLYELHDLTKVAKFPPTDLVVFSYSLNELSEKDASSTLHKAWLATKKALVIIEPGTPNAFKGLKKLRQELINYGAHILTPCPHENACPLSDNDWCHFSVRLERTSLHKYIKDATLSYEDEKFSYLIAVKGPQKTISLPRIIKKPRKRPGHVIFDLCTENGLQQETFSKKDKALYKDAQKLKWGDCLTGEK
ncbi:MAG TPA: hypothetical protein DD412_02950 [Holosporales bacterium]|nr:hypothetical protein [Holosporales bacterium]